MQAVFALINGMNKGFYTYCHAHGGITYVDGSTFALTSDIPRTAETTNTHHRCILNCPFGMCKTKENVLTTAADRFEQETFAFIKQYEEAPNKAQKKKVMGDTGIKPSGFYFRPQLPELKMHRDITNEVLHNVKLGVIKTSVTHLFDSLPKETLAILKKAIKDYDYSGFDSAMTSNLDKVSRFKGREFWVLCQIFPLLLRNMKNQEFTHFWMLLSEICGFYYIRHHKKERIDERFDRVEEILVVLINYLPKLKKMLKTHLLGKHARRDVKQFGNLIDLNAEFFEFTNLRGKITYERGNKISQNKMLPLEEARLQTCNFLINGGVWFKDDSLVTLGSDFKKLFEKKPEPEFNFFVESKPPIKDSQIRALLQTLGESIDPRKRISFFAKVSIRGSKRRSNFISYGSQGSFARVRGGIQYGETKYLLLSPLHFMEIGSISLCDRYKLDLDSYSMTSPASLVEVVNFIHDCAILGCQNMNSSLCTRGFFY